MSLTKNQSAAILTNLGWITTTTGRYTQAVKDFQAGWNLGSALVVDGAVGPKTEAALLVSESRRRASKTTASANFSFSEFACRCGGRYDTCRRIWIVRGQVQSLESYRKHSGSLSIVSGCRCPYHNRAVGGAADSQHMRGTACDISKKYHPDVIASWRLFAGLGYGALSHQVCHVDRRDLSSNNNGGSLSRPMKWVYSNT